MLCVMSTTRMTNFTLNITMKRSIALNALSYSFHIYRCFGNMRASGTNRHRKLWLSDLTLLRAQQQNQNGNDPERDKKELYGSAQCYSGIQVRPDLKNACVQIYRGLSLSQSSNCHTLRFCPDITKGFLNALLCLFLALCEWKKHDHVSFILACCKIP